MASPFITLYRLFSLLLALLVGGLSVVLLITSHSTTAVFFGTASLILSLLPLLHCITTQLNFDLLSYLTLLSVVVAFALTGWLFYTAPDGRPAVAATARVQNRYTGQWNYPRNAVANLLPELDQLRLGLKIAPAVDRLLTQQQADRVTALTTALYEELESDADFHALGTALPHVYTDLWSDQTSRGHYFLYVPKKLNREKPAPLLVFLHGSGGNFKAYTWLFSKIADELDMVLVAPSFGIGEWHEPQASASVERVLDDVSKFTKIDEANRHLIGLSNGGLGVCRVGSHLKDAFKSFVLISPVFDLKIPALPPYPERWQSRPILILTGQQDDRVPLKYVQENAAAFSKLKARVTLATYPDADHFLLFTHRDQILQRITAWLTSMPRT